MKTNGFTLIELLVVVAIMGILGTVTVGGYQAMQRGMTERGVMQNVNQFMRTAYQRAQIDRAPVEVYFWNELFREETENDVPVVCGKAVAVRRAGRVSSVSGNYLYDEFGDLSFNANTESDGDENEDTVQDDDGMYLYNMDPNENGFARSVVSQTTVKRGTNERLLMGGTAKIPAYAYVLKDRKGVSWKSGHPYGFEFAEIQLPHNYVFGSGGGIPRSIDNPVYEYQKSRFNPGVINASSGAQTANGNRGLTVSLSSIRPDGSFKQLGTSDDPTRNL